ncbi:uncharacterized protein LOC119586840 [Penaeus monodon]|uniref:uncharacterized protein LOC119586840 n=1 Tax=Penaeus monodon TaxID=6687 RepID=UPI0018A6D5AB|nr:uncharacterized protein LOC119586840 [Penaeus monodon]
MLATSARLSPKGRASSSRSPSGLVLRAASVNSLCTNSSFPGVAFEDFARDVEADSSFLGGEVRLSKGNDPFQNMNDYSFTPNITVSGETRSCVDLLPSGKRDPAGEFGSVGDALFLADSTSMNEIQNGEAQTAFDAALDYHRRMSISMEEINLSRDSREDKTPKTVEAIKHSHHNYTKSNMNIFSTPLNETADKSTVKSSLYSTFAAIEEMMVSPLKSFHEKVRKRLKKMTSPLNQRYESFTESPGAGDKTKESNSTEEEFFPGGLCLDADESEQLDSTFVFIEEVVSKDLGGPVRAWRRREDEVYGCSVTGVADDQLVTPRTPWHSPIRDLKTQDQGGLPNISWSSPAATELLTSPGTSGTLEKSNSVRGYLCRIYVPSWLVWRPKLFAFVCEFERHAGLNSFVDLMLEEPNPEEHWHVVRSKDITPPEVGEERVIHVPRGMVWVRTSTSGFLTTKARLKDIAYHRPLPCTWRAVTGKSKLVRVQKARGRNLVHN